LRTEVAQHTRTVNDGVNGQNAHAIAHRRLTQKASDGAINGDGMAQSVLADESLNPLRAPSGRMDAEDNQTALTELFRQPNYRR
jgi:hypothetical protein